MVEKCKRFCESYDFLAVEDKLITAAFIFRFRIIFHDTPKTQDFTVPGYNVSACQMERVSTFIHSSWPTKFIGKVGSIRCSIIVGSCCATALIAPQSKASWLLKAAIRAVHQRSSKW